MSVQNPVIASVKCAIINSNSNFYNVTITWTPIQESTYFYAGVFYQYTVKNHKIVDSSNGSYVANIQNCTLDPSTAYTVMVAQCDAEGTLTSAYSVPWNLLQNPLTNLTVYNNLSSLSISAALPTVGNATGIEATLVDTDYNQMANGIITGSSGSLPVDAPLDPAKTYTIYVNPVANGGADRGPSSSLPLLMTSVQVGQVKYDGNNMTVFPGTALTANNLAGWLMAGDETITSNTGNASSVSLTKDWTQLDLSYDYTVLLRALRVVNGTSYGPASNATPVIVAPPVLISASYVGGNVGVTWDVPPILPKPTGGKVAAKADGSVAGKPTDVLGYNGSINISSVQPASSLSVQVNSKYGVAYGPPASVNIPFTAPTISSVSVAKGCVNVAWSAAADAPGYRVCLNDSSGRPITFLDTTDTSAALSASLNAASGYKISVQVYGTSNGILLSGPVSTEVYAITAVPVITEAIYDGTKVSVTWDTVTNTAGITGYSATLLDPETLNSIGNPAAVTGATATTVDITAALETYQRYLVAVQATGTSTVGAPGKAVELISTPPVITAVANDGTNLTASWNAITNPVLTGYRIAYKENGADKTTDTEKTSITLPSAKTNITVAAKSSLATGQATAVPTNTLTAPTISLVSVADGCVNVAWSAVAGAPGYRVYLNDSSGKPINFLDTTDISAALSASLNAASGYKVSVQAYGTSNGILLSGPVSTEVHAIAAVPVITEAIYDGTKVSVTWDTITNIAGITGYNATLLVPESLNPTRNPAAVTGAAATTVDITATLETYRRYLVAVQATGTSTVGELSKAVALISTSPVITAVDISAASVSISWSASPCPSVSGYVVKISDNAAAPAVKTLETEETFVTFANDLTPAQMYVTVTAKSNLATGPVSQQVNLFGTDKSFYPLPVSNTDNTPYLVRSATNQPAAADITFVFPDVFTSAPATLPNVGTFKLEPNSASTVYPYKLTVASDSDAWKFDATSRSTLAADFLNFIKNMEMPDGTNVLIQGGALAMVRQSIALGLPLLYSEILRYIYAFNPDAQTGGYVDLVPGMRLKVDSEVYQSTPPVNNQAGYITNGSATYEIHSYVDGQSPDLKIGFDAFLSAMQRTTVLSPLDSNVDNGGAGVIDLYTSGGCLPYYRLLYPGSLHGPKYTGLVSQTNLPVILGAVNYNTLITATEQYINNGNFSGLTGIFPFFFRGRSIPVPEIAVTLNGEKRWVPVGSTVANLLETEGAMPQLVTATVSGFAMERSIGGLTDNASATSNVAAEAVTTNHVRLEYAVSSFTPTQPGFFGLPLLAGDRIILGAGGSY